MTGRETTDDDGTVFGAPGPSIAAELAGRETTPTAAYALGGRRGPVGAGGGRVTTPNAASGAEPEWVERPMLEEERAWLNVASHALYSAQNAAGVQALAADDLALLRRYQATHTALAELTRLLEHPADQHEDGPRWDCGRDNLGHACGPGCEPEGDPWTDCAACGTRNAECWAKINAESQNCCQRCSHSEVDALANGDEVSS